MSAIMRLAAALLAFAMLAAVSSASAQPAQTPAQAQAPPPPPITIPKKAPAPKAIAPVVRQPDAELDLPDDSNTKRLDRKIGDEAVGGADCRATCARTYYMCLSNDDGALCSTSWTRCVTACPEHSSNF